MSNSKSTLTVIKLVIVLFIVMLLVSGSTYALWEFAFDDITNVVFTTSVDYSCGADGGGPITSSEVVVMPTDCTSEQNAIVREVQLYTQFKNNSISSVATSLWLNINELSSELSNSEHFRYALTTSHNSCNEDVVASGNFNGLSKGDKVNLLNNKKFSTGTPNGTYYLYIWLDKEETNPNTANQSFNLSLGGECSDSSMIPENPVLEDGMIPVIIADNGKVTTVSASDPDWYDYSKQKWANMVLVSDKNRSNYVNNLSKNIEVSEDDILAYYVWVPRYKYKVWTLSTGSSPQTIDIVFESKDSPMVSGTTIGSYRTHPAFWWDNNNDGTIDDNEMLAGIWVGKFETTPDKSSDCYSSISHENCNNTTQNPTILPNEAPLRYQTIKNQFATSQRISMNSNIYGLSGAVTDAHMMKNSEWGAVAYLSHSEYGVNDEVRKNNYYYTEDYIDYYLMTGCGAASEDAEASTTCSIVYGSGVSEYPQSTTGNSTGVFDMSGGAWEYVMGNYNDIVSSSGFDVMPARKYYDLYEIDTIELCTLETCGGHGLFETINWYDDSAIFANSSTPWFYRGGVLDAGLSAGIFRFDGVSGYGGSHVSWRSVIISMEPYVDNVVPTCTLSVTDSGIKFDTYSDDVVSMGLSTSSTATYNSTTSLSLSTGVKYGYVKDAAGNEGSCSVQITNTTPTSDSKGLACGTYWSQYGDNACSSVLGSDYNTYIADCYPTILYRLYDYYCSNGRWQSGAIFYTSSFSECSTYSNNSTFGSCVNGTYIQTCNVNDYDISGYTGSIMCNKTTYSCNSGYTKLNDSYCYTTN